MHPTKEIVILCYVDDFLVLGKSDAEVTRVLEVVSLKVNLQDLGEVSTFLGIQFSLVERETGSNKDPVGHYLDSSKGSTKGSNKERFKGYKSLRLHQTKYVYNMLKRFGKEHLTPVSTPVAEGVKLQKATSEPSKEDLKAYQQEVGSLL